MEEPVAEGEAAAVNDLLAETKGPDSGVTDLLLESILLPYSEEEANILSEKVLERIPDPYGTQGKIAKSFNVSLSRTTFNKVGQIFTIPEDQDDDDDLDYDGNDDLELQPISPLTGSPVPLSYVPLSTADVALGISDTNGLTGESPLESKAGTPVTAADSPLGISDSTVVALDTALSKTGTIVVDGDLTMDNFQWATLLAHMQLRKISRIRTGYSRTKNQIPLLIMLLIVCLFFVFLFYFATKYSSGDFNISQNFDYEFWAWILLGLVMAPGLILLAVPVPRPIEIAWFFVAGGFISALLAYLIYTVQLVEATNPYGICADVDNPGCLGYIEWSTDALILSTIVLGAVSFLFALVCIVSYLLRCFIYPFVLHQYRNSPGFVKVFLAVEPAPGPPGTFSCKYRLPFPLSFTPTKHIFRFRGSISAERFAEGWGKLSDSAPSGELLEGWFEKGLPVAPFTSAEKGRFNAWESLRVGIAGATGLDGFLSSGTWRDPAGMSWGVAVAECSVAGRFFRNMPSGTIHIPRTIPNNPVDHMKNVILPALCAGIPGNYADLEKREAIVFVHGLKQSLQSSAMKLAQLVALATFPSNTYSLWCFDWPGGSVFSFNRTRKESGSPQTEAELAQFLRVLIDGGCKRIHLVGHSMGCRVVTNLGRNGAAGFSKLFRRVGEPAVGEGETKKAELASVILINPEILLHDFILNRFAGTKAYCSSVTIYADRSDNALLMAEVMGREATLGRNPQLVLTRDSQGKPRYLDVDIIDNTSLEQNINAIRHSYFALNSMLVQDLLQIIHLGRGRAKERGRLRKRVGNVWSFLAAPSAAT